MKMILSLFVLYGFLLNVGGCAGENDNGDRTVSSAASASNIRAHMTVLASDGMEGREAGSNGYMRAAHYVADAFAEIGLQPAGDGDSYFQHIEFMSTRLAASSGKLTLQNESRQEVLEFGEDFILRGGFGEEQETITAQLVFAGFGIRAPERQHDDYAGIDVAGKIVIILTGAPTTFPPNERAYYSSSTEKSKLAASLGAVGVMTVYTPVDQKRIPWPRIQSRIGEASMRWRDEKGAPHEGFPELIGDATLSDPGARKMFALTGRDLDAIFEKHMTGGRGGFELGVTATVSRHSILERVSSPNVIALMQGSDSTLRDEIVIYSAHLDHLGYNQDGGGIYNGAYDNAAGVSIILEAARTISEMPQRPIRSILFVAYTAEEKGLQGSDYLAHHPPYPIENIVANINVDMPFLGYPIADVEGYGVEHSSLEDSLMQAAAKNGLMVTPDTRPDLVRLIRSDQFSLVKKGVPGLNIKPGTKSSVPEIDGEAMRDEFLHEHYHNTSDDLDLPFSKEGTSAFARTVVDLGLIVANADDRPQWKEGDFFGERFGRRENE